jgi:hypothetical protein
MQEKIAPSQFTRIRRQFFEQLNFYPSFKFVDNNYAPATRLVLKLRKATGSKSKKSNVLQTTGNYIKNRQLIVYEITFDQVESLFTQSFWEFVRGVNKFDFG